MKSDTSPATSVAERAPAVWEPWRPVEGDYVRVDLSPECEALHMSIPKDWAPLYGRVEIVDRMWDDPSSWAALAEEAGDTVEGMVQTAREHVGHYYYISDSLERDRYLLIDGQHAATELTPVSEDEARAGIERLRTRMATMTTNQKAYARLGWDRRP